VINDENREWTDSPKHQKPQTQQDRDLVHITLMRQNAHKMNFFHIGQPSTTTAKQFESLNG